jgi:hypothetical protein
MKNTKGIACKVNHYHVTAIAVKDDAPVSITFDASERNAREAKKFAAEKLGVKASQVLVSFELEKREFIINCSYDALMNALGAANIGVSYKDAEE